jgi:hypothetical protein
MTPPDRVATRDRNWADNLIFRAIRRGIFSDKWHSASRSSGGLGLRGKPTSVSYTVTSELSGGESSALLARSGMDRLTVEESQWSRF